MSRVIKCLECRGCGYTGWNNPVLSGVFAIGGTGPMLTKCEVCQGKGYVTKEKDELNV